MSSHPLPRRPRLADHAMPRRHLADGEEMVIVHDGRTGGLVRLGAREWGLLACADGTRDLEGILLAAARAGAHAREPALREFLGALHAAGLIASGAAPEAGAAEAVDPARPIDALPGFRLTCDGGGSCCRLYASVIFAPVEAARARATLPLVMDGGASPERAFLPEHGAVPGGASAVAMIDGRCAYLERGGGCGLHAAAGALAKPLGCRLFPATFVDDGEAIRASVAVECACVLESAGAAAGEPIVPEGAATRGDLDPSAHVSVLPRRVAITASGAADRSELARWSRAVLASSEPAGAVAAFWSLSRAVQGEGLAEAAARGALEAPSLPRAAELAAWIESLAARAARREREDAAWRSERDLARRATRWIGRAADALLARGGLDRALEGGGPARPEALYLRAVIHGHQLAGALPLSAALADRAVRVLVARALPAVLAAEGAAADPAARHPLALVEAMLRGHGLSAYAHEASGIA